MAAKPKSKGFKPATKGMPFGAKADTDDTAPIGAKLSTRTPPQQVAPYKAEAKTGAVAKYIGQRKAAGAKGY